MKRLRVERYLEKLEVLKDTLSDLEEWYEEIHQSTQSTKDKIGKKDSFAIYHAYQMNVKYISDITAMIVKDMKKMPKDDYSNLDIIGKSDFFPKSIISKLKLANGLRNRIVHEYNGLLDTMAFEAIKEHIPIFHEFVGKVESWLTPK